jgi:hypothetical protein
MTKAKSCGKAHFKRCVGKRARKFLPATMTSRAQHLTEKLANYIILYQNCSDKVRPHGVSNTNIIYDESYKDWKSNPENPLVEPPLEDEAMCDAYFARCDSICALEPHTLPEYVVGFQSACRANIPLSVYKVSFAAWAGIQAIQAIQLAVMPDRHDIVINATNIA